MHIRNLSGEFIVSMPKQQLHQVRRLLRSLRTSGESREAVDCLTDHAGHGDLFVIATDDHEHLTIVLGATQLHLIVKKQGAYRRLLQEVYGVING